jgi:ABC-type amino acid transport substrate-binding protein
MRSNHCCLYMTFLLCWVAAGLSAEPAAVRVAIYQNEPLVFWQGDGEPQGLLLDILEQVAKQHDWQLTYVKGSWGDGLARIRSGEVDLLVCVAFSADRAQYMDYSQESVLSLWGQVYVRRGQSLEDLLEIEGKRVAVLKNGINGIAFQRLLDAFGLSCTFEYTATYEEAAQMVVAGQADACVINNLHGAQLANIYPIHETPILFNPFKLHFTVAKGHNPEVLAAIDQALVAGKGDRDSFYYRSLNRWAIMREPARTVMPTWLLLLVGVASILVVMALVWIRLLYLQIERRHRAEAALEQNRQFLDSVFHAIQDGISIIDRGMNVQLVNRKMKEMYPGLVDGGRVKCYHAYHCRQEPCVVCPSIRAFASADLEMDEVPFVVDGKVKGVQELYAFPILDIKGEVTGVVEYVRDITARKQAEKEREQLIKELRRALDEINTLRGILPVCAYCKKVRDDSGYWNQIEAYISQHSEARFSHSICPDCLKEHSDEMFGPELRDEALKRLHAVQRPDGVGTAPDEDSPG